MLEQELKYAQGQHIDLPDSVLMRQMLEGDHYSFEALYQRYYEMVFNFATRYLGDFDLACDVTQHVFFRLYISMPFPFLNTTLKPWLLRVARNRCLDELRRKRGVYFSQLESTDSQDDDDALSPLSTIADPYPLPQEILEQHDLQQSLQRAIRALPAKFRTVVLLRYKDEMSFPEIGRMLNMPAATAKTYFRRARPLLRAALDVEG
jgi:RNA polymerase sigma factor (sigma-70 family)